MLKNWKTTGSDRIPAELIKYGGLELHIWNEPKLPEEWNKAIVIPVYKDTR